jgi:glycosyltransferase involved in cell wall biosynthesis
MQDHVTFIQWLPNHELAGIFAASDVLVHPSEPYRDWEEQFGWTMLQAASSALPVIATRMGSIPEAVLDEQTGILVEPKRPDQLAEAMIRLGTDPQLRARMGQAGREYVSSKLSHQAVATRMEDFLKNL